MATGTSPTVSSPAFHANDPEQTTDYRTLSVLAIISLVFGLAAPLAIAGPFLLAIPLFGIAVSLLALRGIAVSDGVLAGRWAATTGLVLCVASALLPVSHDLIQRMIRASQTEEFGRSWIAMLTSGDSKQAFHMTVDGNRAQPAPEPGAPPKPAPYQTFIDQPIIKSLQAVGPDAKIRLSETLSYQSTTFRSITIRQQFAVSPASAASAGGSQPTKVELTIQRLQLPGQGMSRWLITHFEPAKAAGESTPNH